MELSEEQLAKVLGWIEWLCGNYAVRGSAEWQDLVSICCLRMVQILPRYDAARGMTLESWAFLAAKQALISEFQHRTRVRRQHFKVSYEEMIEGGWEPEKVDVIHLEIQALEKAMKILSEMEHTVITHRYIDNMTLQAIGDRYSYTKEGIRLIEANALRKLYKFLKK